MDEVGLVVRRIDPDGFIHVVRLGGIGRRSLAARRITFLGRHGPVPGIIGVKSHHLTDPADALRIPSVDEAYADGCIVGSSLKVDGYTWNPVDPERAERFVAAARAA